MVLFAILRNCFICMYVAEWQYMDVSSFLSFVNLSAREIGC